MRKSRTKITCTMLLALSTLAVLHERTMAQHTKVPKEPFQVVDASTGKSIPEILVIPVYSSYKGIFIVPEGPSKATVRTYLDNPFVYRTGEPFLIKQPRVFTGLPLLFVFIGKGTDLDGMLVIARGYRPLWTDDLWWYPGNPGYERKLTLYPISNDEWSQISRQDLSFSGKGTAHKKNNCEIWSLPEPCKVKSRFDKEERELVRSFLQQARTETKSR